MALLQVFGTITPPSFIDTSPTALGAFITNIVRFFIVLAGLYAFFNIILAGYQFISSGDDPKSVSAAWAKIYQSLIGLVIVASSVLITAVISYILFGSPATLLQITVTGP